jgi:hypothetical protein
MAKTKISDLGSSICVDDQNEKYVPALGDGAAIPGELCLITAADGKVDGSDVGDKEFFVGILMESKITGTETAIVAGVACRLVKPKSGHDYRIRCDDLGATLITGTPMKFGANDGYAVKTANILDPGVIGYLSLEGLTGDTVCELTWR